MTRFIGFLPFPFVGGEADVRVVAPRSGAFLRDVEVLVVDAVANASAYAVGRRPSSKLEVERRNCPNALSSRPGPSATHRSRPGIHHRPFLPDQPFQFHKLQGAAHKRHGQAR